MRYTMTEKQAGESGLNCGGSVRIYTEVIEPDEGADFYGRVLTARQVRSGCALATLLKSRFDATGEGRLWLGADGSTYGSLGTPEADRQVEERLPEVITRERGLVCALDSDAELGETAEVFIEPFLPEPVLYVFGGGHVGGQICALAKNVGFRVVLIDDRPTFANPERHPQADECLVAGMEEVFAQLPIDDQSYIIAATRGHQHDEIVVEAAIKTPARYIGMLGSERKKLILWRRISERGGRLAALGRRLCADWIQHRGGHAGRDRGQCRCRVDRTAARNAQSVEDEEKNSWRMNCATGWPPVRWTNPIPPTALKWLATRLA